MTEGVVPGITPEQACELGDRYREARGGVRYSPRQVYRWYAQSALAGYAQGQNNLGACFQHGIGCRQSYGRALPWYRRAAAQGLGIASSNLGHLYLHGQGVAPSRSEALAWFQKALAQGNEQARELVKSLGGVVKPAARVDAPPDGNDGEESDRHG